MTMELKKHYGAMKKVRITTVSFGKSRLVRAALPFQRFGDGEG